MVPRGCGLVLLVALLAALVPSESTNTPTMIRTTAHSPNPNEKENDSFKHSSVLSRSSPPTYPLSASVPQSRLSASSPAPLVGFDSPMMVELQETVREFHRRQNEHEKHKTDADREVEREWERSVDRALLHGRRPHHHPDEDEQDEDEFLSARYRFRDLDRSRGDVPERVAHRAPQSLRRRARETATRERNPQSALLETYADAEAEAKDEDGVFGWCKTCVFVLERIKKGTNMLLPAICSEIYISFPNAYALCHQVLNALSLNGNNVRYWLFEGCYKYEIYQAKEWVKPCPSHVMCTVLKNLQNKSFCKPLPMEDPFKEDTDAIT